MSPLRALALFGAAGLATLTLACGGDGDGDSTSTASGDGGSAEASSSAGASPEGSQSPDASATADGSASPSGTADGTPSPGGGSATAENNNQDGTPTPEPTPVVGEPFEPATGNYCDTVTATSPPNSVFGLLKLDGTDMPAGTEVMVAFDGVPGPAEASKAAGGYRVDFGVATTGDCANKNGAKVSIVIDGTAYDTGQTVGSAVAFRFDIQN